MRELIAEGRKLSVSDATIIRRQFYDEHFGLRDYLDPKGEGKHPFSLMLMNPKEDVISNGSFRRAAMDFANYKIGEFFKLSLLEYLKLSPYEAEELRKICMDLVVSTNAGIENASSEVDKAQRRLRSELRNS